MRPRSVGRRLALQYLFMADQHRFQDVQSPQEFFRFQREAVRDGSPVAGDDEPVFEAFDAKQDEAEEFAQSLIALVGERRHELDAAIEKAARNWTIARMGVVERNVIRIAAAELAVADTPKKVILDEAVELAKRFGDRESGAFVNGIADRLAGGIKDPGEPGGTHDAGTPAAPDDGGKDPRG